MVLECCHTRFQWFGFLKYAISPFGTGIANWSYQGQKYNTRDEGQPCFVSCLSWQKKSGIGSGLHFPLRYAIRYVPSGLFLTLSGSDGAPGRSKWGRSNASWLSYEPTTAIPFLCFAPYFSFFQVVLEYCENSQPHRIFSCPFALCWTVMWGEG